MKHIITVALLVMIAGCSEHSDRAPTPPAEQSTSIELNDDGSIKHPADVETVNVSNGD